LIEEIFKEEEAISICGMAISPNKQQDQMMWIGTKNEEFSVRNAYRLEKGRVSQEK
jgi:hypothetical protein